LSARIIITEGSIKRCTGIYCSRSSVWNYFILYIKHFLNQERVAAEGGVGPLVELLIRGEEGARSQAAGALKAMTLTRPTNQKMVAEMVAGLLKCAKETSERARAASAMASLARDQLFNRVSLAAAGAIPQLIRILSEVPETTLREVPPAEGTSAVAGASAVASASPPARNIRSMAMAARAVTAINKSHAQVQATHELHSCVAQALRYLAMAHPPNQAAIAHDGAVPCLIALLEGSPPEVQAQAAGALWSLTLDAPDNQRLVAELGGIPPLVALLTRPSAVSTTTSTTTSSSSSGTASAAILTPPSSSASSAHEAPPAARQTRLRSRPHPIRYIHILRENFRRQNLLLRLV
jgi:hypothetical protein